MNTIKTILLGVMVLWLIAITLVCVNQHDRIEAMDRKDDVDTISLVAMNRLIGEEKTTD